MASYREIDPEDDGKRLKMFDILKAIDRRQPEGPGPLWHTRDWIVITPYDTQMSFDKGNGGTGDYSRKTVEDYLKFNDPIKERQNPRNLRKSHVIWPDEKSDGEELAA